MQRLWESLWLCVIAFAVNSDRVPAKAITAPETCHARGYENLGVNPLTLSALYVYVKSPVIITPTLCKKRMVAAEAVDVKVGVLLRHRPAHRLRSQ